MCAAAGAGLGALAPFFRGPVERIAFAASRAPVAAEARERLVARYGDCPVDAAQVMVCLGGDGVMLDTLRGMFKRTGGLPVYGMNRGTVGFLMNAYAEDDLPQRLGRAQAAVDRKSVV